VSHCVAVCRNVLQCAVAYGGNPRQKKAFCTDKHWKGEPQRKDVLHCVAVCGSASQYVAVRCSVLQCVAVPKEGACLHECCSVLQYDVVCSVLQCFAMCCSVLQCVAVCCSVLQCVAVCRSTAPNEGACPHECVAVWRSWLQYNAVCCSVLQCVAVLKEGVYLHKCVAACN